MNLNISKGLRSYDSTSTGEIIAFLNKNITPYPTEIGSQKFDLVPVKKQKDIMLNVARLYAQQEYDRILEMVSVLQKQANQLKRRLEITDAVHAAEYQFQIYHDKIYWLAFDKYKQKTVLLHHGPEDSLVTDNYDYLAKVKCLGDYTWIEVE